MSVLPFTIYQRHQYSRRRRYGFVIPYVIGFCLMVLAFLTWVTLECVPSAYKEHDRAYAKHVNVVIRSDGEVFKYDSESPLVFVSGTNLSGSELLRDILNTHPDIRCTSEKYFMHKLLLRQKHWFKVKNESVRLVEAGISKELLETAVGSFMLEIMARSGPPVKCLCNEDFHSVRFGEALTEIFPKSKFILVIRNPLHYAHLKMQDHNLTSFNETLFKEYIREWDDETQQLTKVCNIINWEEYSLHEERPLRCKIVLFERLFLDPPSVVLPVLQFIFENDSIPQIPQSMRSSLLPGKNEDLLEWVENVPERVVEDIGNSEYNFVRFRYHQLGYPPNYHLLRQYQ